MRPVVALLDARPETIAADYRRLLELAQLAPPDGPARLVADGGPGTWLPGAVSPPWQLAGCLAGSAPGGEVHVVGRPVAGLWDRVLAEAGAGLAEPAARADHPVRSQALVPTLAAVRPRGLAVPAGLAGGGALLLPVPTVGRGWPVAGAVALLLRLLVPAPVRPRRFPLAELAAEAVALARQTLQPRGAVLDGTVWQVRGGALERWPAGRNVLIAGADPVAVDAVACRLAGADPRRVPWLRLCSERGLGEGRLERIRLAGQAELLDLDFGLPERTLVAADRLPGRRPLADLVYNLTRRPAALRGHRSTPWGRLAAARR
ncbi:MAG: hypothetical protein R6X35_05810 [Candidatus Krumholzibacteriia bacterium]